MGISFGYMIFILKGILCLEFKYDKYFFLLKGLDFVIKEEVSHFCNKYDL